MKTSIDLNADMGEGFGPWTMGDDAGLMRIISSANIACGFHAGDPDVMARTMDLALANGVALGAHPGFADLQGFGRRQMALSTAELTHLVQYQLGAAQALARARGASLAHFKLHGALSNMASQSVDIARACFAAALAVAPDIRLVILPQTAMEAAARDLGAHWLGEIFADRTYCEDGTLTPRGAPDAMIHDPQFAAARIIEMIAKGGIVSTSGKVISARIDTVCVHGDDPNARAMAAGLREGLERAGLRIAAPSAPAAP